MSIRFLAPANINDFPDHPRAYHRLLESWNLHLNGFASQVQAGHIIPDQHQDPGNLPGDYLEWMVKRKNNEIIRIDLTCEPPAYWQALWQASPGRVLELYRQLLDNPDIVIEDLQLMHECKAVIDEGTGQPVYNPLNMWNQRLYTSDAWGGGVHMTRIPHNNRLLYIQLPADLNAVFSIPGVADITPYFTVTRGGETVSAGNIQYQLNLHLTIQAPPGMPPLSQLQVAGSGLLKSAGQIVEKLRLVTPAPQPDTLETFISASAEKHTQPIQMFHEDVFNALYSTRLAGMGDKPINLLSYSNFIPPVVQPGKTYNMVVIYKPVPEVTTVDPLDKTTYPRITISHPGIEARAFYLHLPFAYVVPGNSFLSQVLALNITVKVKDEVLPGLYEVFIKEGFETGQGTSHLILLQVQ